MKTTPATEKAKMKQLAAESMQTLRENGQLVFAVTNHYLPRCGHTLRIERHAGVAAVVENGIGTDRFGEILTSYCRSLAPSVEAIYPNLDGLERLKEALAEAGWKLECLADQPSAIIFRLSRAA